MSFISYLINGISLGSVYALIALGYTMVYGIAKMLNFAHGDVIMVGAFITYTMCSTMGLSPVIGVLAAVIACTLLGMAIEKAFKKGFFSVSGSDHRNRCQLSAAECSSFDLWCKCQGIYFCSIRSGCEAGRRTDQYYRRDHCYDCYLSDHYGRAFYQQDQSRTGNVSSIRG